MPLPISIELIAQNSSGSQSLDFTRSSNGVEVCLHGEYNGNKIQIDFNELNKRDVEDLIFILRMMINTVN